MAWTTDHAGWREAFSLVCSFALLPAFVAHQSRPRRYPFHNQVHHSLKVDKIAEWLGSSASLLLAQSSLTTRADLPLKSRPHLITAYAPEVDQEGHRTGPHSAAINETLLEMDAFAAGLFSEIEKRNLTDVVDVIFVSDHGMTE